MKISMIGLGKLGLACAQVMAEKYEVNGYDVVPRKSSSVKIKSTVKETVEGCDLIFIAVQTPHDVKFDGSQPISHLEKKDFNYEIVKQCLRDVNEHVTKDQLVVLISTVLPGTTRDQLRECITNARFIYNPYLIAMGSVEWDMVNPEMVIIGTEDGHETGDASMLIDFYKPLMQNNPRYVVGTWDEAESIKIFYNTFISAKIGIVNMIQDVAMKNGNIDVDVVTGALANSNIRIMSPKYMIAGMGDAGPCVLPTFPVRVDNETFSIQELFARWESNDLIGGTHMLISSATYACTKRDEKKVDTVTCREYSGDIIKITTNDGKVLETTVNHLIPVMRGRKRIIIRADEILVSDKLYGV